MTIHDLPAVNATLNGLSAVFLMTGYVFIRRGNQTAHRNSMVAALITSAIFLTCYLIYHFNAGRTEFREPQSFRPYYLALLLTHTVLAVVIVPLIATTMSRAIRARYDLHKKIARWTWPLWMYVSVTGVIIYLILYKIYPQVKV
jgi:putative membrane protein